MCAGSEFQVAGQNTQKDFSEDVEGEPQDNEEGRVLRSESSRGSVSSEKLAEIGEHGNRVEALVAKGRDFVFYPGFNR